MENLNAQHHLHWTYRQLRILSGTVLVVVPVVIVGLAWFQYDIVLPTLSHYYFSEINPAILRTLFTGFLILVGGIMMCYRGFDEIDNWIHNIAGASAICVAIFPKRCDINDIQCVENPLATLHLPSAVVLFIAAAIAVWYGGGNSFKARLIASELILLSRWKLFALMGMVSGIGIYIPFLLGVTPLPLTGVLMVELTGFFGFAFYWLGMPM